MNIEIGKWYRTRGGEKAYVACEMPGPLKFCGYHIQGSMAVPTGWYADGSYMQLDPSSADLVHLWVDKPVIDWDKERDWVKAIAMDINRTWWRYSSPPVRCNVSWVANDFCQPLHPTEYPTNPDRSPWTDDWKDSLVVRPS